MAHAIDFTLFHGGVASAPAAELPFAGSSFDVQAGTARRAVLGVPEVESVAVVNAEVAAKAASSCGVLSLEYSALWEAVSVSRSVSVGPVSVSTIIELVDMGAGAQVAELGTASTAAGVEISLASIAREAELGVAGVLNALTLDVAGVESQSDLGYVAVATTSSCVVELEAVQRVESAFGELTVLQTVVASPDSVTRGATFGVFSLSTSCEIGSASIAREAELGVAGVLNALTLDVSGVESQSDLGYVAVATTSSCVVDFEGLGRSTLLGKPSVSIEVFVSTAEMALFSVPDVPSLVSGADFTSVALMRPVGIVADSSEVGNSVDIETSALAWPAGLTHQALLGQPDIALIIKPDSLQHESVIGGIDMVGGTGLTPEHTADVASFIREAVFGVPSVGFGALVNLEGVRPRDHVLGSLAFSWRKCPRWDLLAKVRMEADLSAEIRPAPVTAQVWRGEGCVLRERTMSAVVARWADLSAEIRPAPAAASVWQDEGCVLRERTMSAVVARWADLSAEIRPAPVAASAWQDEGCVLRERTMSAVVARWADLHTVARRKNAMDAAVRRKEQI